MRAASCGVWILVLGSLGVERPLQARSLLAYCIEYGTGNTTYLDYGIYSPLARLQVSSNLHMDVHISVFLVGHIILMEYRASCSCKSILSCNAALKMQLSYAQTSESTSS